jgi:protein-tyrosine phosphatase
MKFWRIQSIFRRRSRLLFDLAFARRNSENRLRAAPIQNVLIVCYGNIYRSPFLAGYLKSRLGDLIAVRSSGLHPVGGRCSPEPHIEASGRFGVSLREHRSAILTEADVQWSDVIVVMDRHNWDELVRRGAAVRKLIWAGSLAGGKPEIADPYTLDDAGREAVLQRLVRAGDNLINAIRRRNVALP